jgi:O-antigen/teichoic acid export membrane protein
MKESFSDIIQSSARGGIFLFVGYFLSLVLLAVCSIIVARLLGPDGYGLFVLALVVPNLILYFLDLGVGTALTRFAAKFRAEGRNDLAASILKSGFFYIFFISVIFSILCFLFSDSLATYVLNRPGMGLLIKFSSLMILLQTSFNYLSASFIGLDKMEGNAIILNIQALVKTVLSALLLVLGFGVFGALTSQIISYIFACCLGGIFFYKLYKGLGKPSNNKFIENMRVMISYGFPLYVSNLLGTVISQIQLLILALFVSNMDIGNFNVATGLLTLISVLTYPAAALFPAFSKVKRGSSELNSLFKFSVKYTAIFVVPGTMITAILSKDIVFTLYGRVYTSAPLFLSLYVITNLYAGFGSVVINYIIYGSGETRISLYSGLINMIIFLPLAFLLTKFYGVPGFLIAIIISFTCSFAYSLWSIIKKLQVKFDLKSSSRIYLASILSAIPTLLLSLYAQLASQQFYYRFLGLILYACVFVFLYLTLLPAVKAIEESDIENFRLLLKRIKLIQPLINLVLTYESKLISIFKKE